MSGPPEKWLADHIRALAERDNITVTEALRRYAHLRYATDDPDGGDRCIGCNHSWEQCRTAACCPECTHEGTR